MVAQPGDANVVVSSATPDKTTATLWKLFQDVVTPAVLGNTAWAVLSILIRDNEPSADTPWRVLALVLVTVFFLGDWLGGNETSSSKIKVNIVVYAVITAAFYIAIAGYAVAHAEARGGVDWSLWLLALMLLTSAAGHGLGIWTDPAKADQARFRLAQGWVAALGSVVALLAAIAPQLFTARLGEKATLIVQIPLLLAFVLAWVLTRGRTIIGYESK